MIDTEILTHFVYNIQYTLLYVFRLERAYVAQIQWTMKNYLMCVKHAAVMLPTGTHTILDCYKK